MKIIEKSLYHKVEFEEFDKKLKKKVIRNRLDKICELIKINKNIGYCSDCNLITERGVKGEYKENTKKTCWKCEKPFMRIYYE